MELVIFEMAVLVALPRLSTHHAKLEFDFRTTATNHAEELE
jgi:hypothetical protein